MDEVIQQIHPILQMEPWAEFSQSYKPTMYRRLWGALGGEWPKKWHFSQLFEITGWRVP